LVRAQWRTGVPTSTPFGLTGGSKTPSQSSRRRSARPPSDPSTASGPPSPAPQTSSRPKTARASWQQAPLGATLSLARRLRLLDWAGRTGAWIIEDDYLGELQLAGRAAPALASLDSAGRVIHLGSFSKTLSPALRLGFLVAPPQLASRLAEVAACLAPPPGPSLQQAASAFIRDGHYMRHLRPHAGDVEICGLAALLPLPDGVPDRAIVKEAAMYGMAPAPLSAWYASPASARSGLLLGIATAPRKDLAGHCERIVAIAKRHM
jgi:GntR family transcriptional regulator/MocR family aminotransferase